MRTFWEFTQNQMERDIGVGSKVYQSTRLRTPGMLHCMLVYAVREKNNKPSENK